MADCFGNFLCFCYAITLFGAFIGANLVYFLDHVVSQSKENRYQKTICQKFNNRNPAIFGADVTPCYF